MLHKSNSHYAVNEKAHKSEQNDLHLHLTLFHCFLIFLNILALVNTQVPDSSITWTYFPKTGEIIQCQVQEWAYVSKSSWQSEH